MLNMVQKYTIVQRNVKIWHFAQKNMRCSAKNMKYGAWNIMHTNIEYGAQICNVEHEKILIMLQKNIPYGMEKNVYCADIKYSAVKILNMVGIT